MPPIRITLENKHLFLNKQVVFNIINTGGIKERFIANVEKVNKKSLKISGFPQVGNNLKVGRDMYGFE